MIKHETMTTRESMHVRQAHVCATITRDNLTTEWIKQRSEASVTRTEAQRYINSIDSDSSFIKSLFRTRRISHSVHHVGLSPDIATEGNHQTEAIARCKITKNSNRNKSICAKPSQQLGLKLLRTQNSTSSGIDTTQPKGTQ